MALSPHPTFLTSPSSPSAHKTGFLQEWLPKGAQSWLGMGRQAIVAALDGLGVLKGTKILTPAYQCPSALDPLLAFGVEPVYYDLNADLAPDLVELESLISRVKPRLLMVIHYFGFPLQRLDEMMSLASRVGLPVLEDCAHGLFSKRGDTLLGSWGDAAVFSLAKTLPVPSGGVLVLNGADRGNGSLRLSAPSPEWAGLLKMGLYEMERLFPFSLRTVLRSIGTVDRQVRRWMEAPPDGLGLCTTRPIGRWARRTVERCAPHAIVKRRRENYEAVLKVLSTAEPGILKPIFPSLPAGVCPLGCPILLPAKRDEVMLRLWRRGMPVRAIWDRLPGPIRENLHGGAAYLRAHILVLPVHQGLTIDEAMRVAEITMNEAIRVLGSGTGSC